MVSFLHHCCPSWSSLLPLFSLELLDDILREKPQEADGIDSVVVVDNVPQVGPERLEKLKNVIHKIFSKFGKITTEFYPEADGLTKGYEPVICRSWFFFSTLLGNVEFKMWKIPFVYIGTSSLSMLLLLRRSRQWRMQTDTNSTSSIRSGSISSQTLTSECAVSDKRCHNCKYKFCRIQD